MSDTDELIKEIAAKHGIALSRDDPILIVQTLNKRFLEDSAKAQEEILERYKEEMEALSLRWSDDAKAKAERVLNAALSASREAMAKSMHEGAVSIVSMVRQEMEKGLANMKRPVRDAKRLVTLNVVAAVITLIAASITLWASR